MKWQYVMRVMSIFVWGLIAAMVVGCGKQSRFQKQEFSAVAVANEYTKPKIDILVFQDNSASMLNPMSAIKPQLNSFLSGIDSRWDFHFTVVPLQKVQSLTSKYIVAQDCSTITGTTCLTPSQVSYFNNTPSSQDWGWINSTNFPIGNEDKGFQNIEANLLHSSMTSTGFIRPDAALAMMVITNGEDVSGVTYYDPDGDGTPEIDYRAGSASETSLNYYKNFLENYKGVPDLTKFYSVVALNTPCYGNPAFRGIRYMDASYQLDSNYYNLCDGGVANVLENIRTQLNSLMEAIVFNYAVITEAPIEASIVVKKNGVVVPKSAVNGWQYAGYQVNKETSFLPAPGNKKTGYFIKMNGTAVFKGSDIVTIDYQKN